MKRTPQTIFRIVTPSYNQAQFIRQTIDSVLAQKKVTVEYWVIDGKSTDKTAKVLRSYGKKIKWVSEKDRGQTDAINKGIKKFSAPASDTNYIFAYINSDDYYLPGALAKVARAFQTHPEKAWLVGDCQIINEKGIMIQNPVRWYKKLLRYVLSQPVLLIGNPIPQPAVFIRWEAVQKVGLFNTKLRYVMDYEYWLRLFAKWGAPLVLDESLAAFRIHGLSKGGSQFVSQFDEEYSVAQKFTQNQAWLLLHSVHNEMIKFVYRLIK